MLAPSLVWYFAEGATHSGFDLFYLLYNPSDTEATVRVRYLRPSGDPLEKTYERRRGERFNVWVNLEEFDGARPRWPPPTSRRRSTWSTACRSSRSARCT